MVIYFFPLCGMGWKKRDSIIDCWLWNTAKKNFKNNLIKGKDFQPIVKSLDCFSTIKSLLLKGKKCYCPAFIIQKFLLYDYWFLLILYFLSLLLIWLRVENLHLVWGNHFYSYQNIKLLCLWRKKTDLLPIINSFFYNVHCTFI